VNVSLEGGRDERDLEEVEKARRGGGDSKGEESIRDLIMEKPELKGKNLLSMKKKTRLNGELSTNTGNI